VETFGDRVYRLALRITGRTRTRRSAQDALWTAARKIHTFKGESAFGSWLYRIAANAAYQKLRTRKRRPTRSPSRTCCPRSTGTASTSSRWTTVRSGGRAALQGELRRVLTTAVDALPDDYRTPWCCTTSRGCRIRHRETLGISLPAVKSRVHRSRLFVRKRLAST